MTTQQVNRMSRFEVATVERQPFTPGTYIMAVLNPSRWMSRSSDLDFDVLKFSPALSTAVASETQLPVRGAVWSLEELATVYLHDVETLSKNADQVRAFLSGIVDSQIAHVGGKGVAIIDSRRELCKSLLNANFTGGAPILSAGADLCAKPLGEVFATCKEDIARRTEQLAQGISRALLLGAADGAFGLCDWPGDSTCWYVRHEFEIRFTGTNTEERNARTLVTTRHYEKWRAATEAHLIRASTVSGFPEHLRWPRALWNALGRMPPFLRPLVKTVVGTLVKKRIVRWKFGEGSHVDFSKIPEPEFVRMPQPWLDPFICIGPVVLAGWD